MSNFEQAVKKQQERMNDIKLPKKTADEMFEEFGYTYFETQFYYVYESYGNKITFSKTSKAYRVFDEMIGDHYAKSVYGKLHLAIHQKLIELGWLDMSE